MEKSIKTLLIAACLSLYSIAALAVTVPNKFSANTPAVAADVNENFSVLESAINNSGSGSVEFKQRGVSDNSGVGKATCLSSQTVVSAACYCTGDPNKGTNIGILFACTVNSNSAIGACLPYLGFQENRSTPIQVIATCASNSANRLSDRNDSLAPIDLEADLVVEQLRGQAATVNNQLTSGK